MRTDSQDDSRRRSNCFPGLADRQTKPSSPPHRASIAAVRPPPQTTTASKRVARKCEPDCSA